MYPNKITLHHSLTYDGPVVNWDAIRRWHKGITKGSKYKMNDIGYHHGIELINKRYEILTGRLMTVKGAHVRGHNDENLGIVLVGNFDLAPPPKEQWDLAVDFVSSLCQILFITQDHVYGHNEFDPHKSCPGKRFNMNLFRAELTI